MYKTLIYSLLLMSIVLISCKEKETRGFAENTSVASLEYDTTAIDSFSAGATSIDIARQIKISSKAYQDSLLQVKMALEKENAEAEAAILKKEKVRENKDTKVPEVKEEIPTEKQTNSN